MMFRKLLNWFFLSLHTSYKIWFLLSSRWSAYLKHKYLRGNSVTLKSNQSTGWAGRLKNNQTSREPDWQAVNWLVPPQEVTDEHIGKTLPPPPPSYRKPAVKMTEPEAEIFSVFSIEYPACRQNRVVIREAKETGGSLADTWIWS